MPTKKDENFNNDIFLTITLNVLLSSAAYLINQKYFSSYVPYSVASWYGLSIVFLVFFYIFLPCNVKSNIRKTFILLRLNLFITDLFILALILTEVLLDNHIMSQDHLILVMEILMASNTLIAFGLFLTVIFSCRTKLRELIKNKFQYKNK